MAEALQHSSTDELATIPYEVIRDKSFNTHDHLYKLIIIGDSCKCDGKISGQYAY